MSEVRHIDWHLAVTTFRECREWTPEPSTEPARQKLMAEFRRQYNCEPPPWFEVKAELLESRLKESRRLVLGSRWWQRLLGIHVLIDEDAMVEETWGFMSRGSVSIPVLPKVEAQWRRE